MYSRQSTVSVSFKQETSVIIDQIPDLTRGRVFPTLLFFMEAAYMFAVSSMSVYCLYGFGEFMVLYDDTQVLSMTTESKFYGCCVVLFFGVLCDSYIGHYYSVLIFLCINTCLPILHFTIAIYPHVYESTVKLRLTDASTPFWGILLCSEPVRITVIATAVLERNYLRRPRTFFAILVYVWYMGAALGGLAVYLSCGSRTGYAIILGVDVFFMCLYVGFWLFSRRTLLRDRGPWAIVERAVAYTICGFLRKLDKWLLRKYFFKRRSESNDFRCVVFSERSANNSRTLRGILLVTVPLIAYLSMLVILDTLYEVQIAMLAYSHRLFPLLTIRACIYLVLFPPMEFFFASRFLDKWFRNSVTKQLTLTGIGAFVISFSIMWTSIVQHEIVEDLDFYRHYKDAVTHVSITNCLETPVNMRGKYYNKITSTGMDKWAILDPMRPLFVLRIPESHLPFHVEFENANISMYDEYKLNLTVGSNNWYVLFPEGLRALDQLGNFKMSQVHPACYATPGLMAMNPNVFRPATICVMCALAVCNGYLTLQGKTVIERIDVPLGKKMNESLIRLNGKYQVSVRFGELGVSGDPEEVHFKRLASYLLIVYEKRQKRSSEIKEDDGIVFLERSSAVHVLETFPPRRKSGWWIIPTVVLHAVGQVFAEVSLMTYLYIVSPVDVRTTVFCLTRFLSLPSYWYLFKRNAMSLQEWMPLYFFSLGCANCFFMIMYFFSTVYYIHRFLPKKAPARQQRSLQAGSDTAVRLATDELPSDRKEN